MNGLEAHARDTRDMEPHTATLTRLAQDAKVIVELGTRTGVSTWAMLDGLPDDGRLVSVDNDFEVPRRVAQRVREDPRWSIVLGDDRIKQLQNDLPQADLVFIDTSHEYHHTAAELELALRLGATTIVLHDWALHDVEDAARGFAFREGFAIAVEHSEWGLGILTR